MTFGPAPERRLRFSVAPFPSRDERAGAVAVFRDVTEVRRIETVRRDFVANASHELKTPLTAIRGFAERLADAELPDAAAKQAVEAILGNAKRLGVLVEDLLELSRIESGSVPLRPNRSRWPRWPSGCCASSTRACAAASWRARWSAAADVRVVADRGALEQVLANLLDNAIKYTPAGGRVAVRVRPVPERPRCASRSRTAGSAFRARICPASSNASTGWIRADHAPSGGTGLGLAIVKHQVQAMGGQLGVESQLGRGSCFWVELPAAPGA